MESTFLQGLVLLLLTAIGTILGFGVKAVLRSLGNIDEKLGNVTVQVAEVKTWADHHEGEDNRRFDALMTERGIANG